MYVDECKFITFCCACIFISIRTSPNVGASGHTVSLLAVTVVLVLECSTRGEGN